MALALILGWIVLGILFERHSERQLQAELERHGLALVAAADLDPQGIPRLERQLPDPRFGRPASGLYWQVTGPGGELHSRSLWDGQIVLPFVESSSGWFAGNSTGPFEPSVRVVAREIRPDPDGPSFVVAVAADRAPVTQAREEFGRETGIFLVALWLLLALAAWVQVRMGLRPLAEIREELEELSRAAEARLDVMMHPKEIRPLTRAINQVADQRADDIARARARAKDLAHALKTPLTALRLQAEAQPPRVLRNMMHSISLLSGAIESELARTGSQPIKGRTQLSHVLGRITAVVSRTPAGQEIAIRSDVQDKLCLPMQEDAALEALGALIENAVRHARREVFISGRCDENGPWVLIEDDGTGIEKELRNATLERGGRLDERSGTHGLGLSIAQDLVAATGGRLTLGSSAAGGLAVKLSWPDDTSRS